MREAHKEEFFEILINNTSSTSKKNRTVNIDIDRFGILEQIINWTVEKDIITMKSLILAQDER